MGCGASTAQNVAGGSQTLGQNGTSQPLNEATALGNEGPKAGVPVDATAAAAAPIDQENPLKVLTSDIESVEVLGDEEPDSPVTVRVGEKKKQAPVDEDTDVVTIWDETAGSSKAARLEAEAKAKALAEADAAAIAAALAADEAEEEAEIEQERTSVMLSLKKKYRGQADGAEKEMLEAERLEDDPLGREASGAPAWGTGWDPDAKVEINLSVLNEIDPCPGPGPASRYEGTLTLSEDDSDDEGGASTTFSLSTWKRFYHWNKKKHADLLKVFWKSFDPKKFSMHCMSYRHQDKFFAAYQCDNLMTGFIHRLHAGGVKCFGISHALYNYNTQHYKIVGLLVVQGQSLPKALTLLPDFEDYFFVKANPSDSTVKTFLGALLTSSSPAPELNLMASREILLC